MNTQPEIVGEAFHASLGRYFGLRAAVVRSLAAEMKVTDVHLPQSEVKRYQALTSKALPSFVEAMAAQSALRGGIVAGVKFDPDQARESLAQHAAASATVQELRRVARAIELAALLRRGRVSEDALGALAALEGHARTEAGKSEKALAKELRRLVKRTKSPRAASKVEAGKDLPKG